MKMTDRELSNIVDDVTAEIRSETLDSDTVESAARRVWARMTGEQASIAAGWRPVEQIRNCDDFQALIPAYLQGYLSSARTTLLEDHSRECVPCRKALKQARHGNQEAIRLQEQRARADATRYRANVIRWAVAAVVVVGLGLFAWPWIQRSINSLYTLSAIVEAAQGGVYKVTGDKTQAVKAGEKLLGGEHIRTAKGFGAGVKVSGGEAVGVRARSGVLGQRHDGGRDDQSRTRTGDNPGGEAALGPQTLRADRRQPGLGDRHDLLCQQRRQRRARLGDRRRSPRRQRRQGPGLARRRSDDDARQHPARPGQGRDRLEPRRPALHWDARRDPQPDRPATGDAGQSLLYSIARPGSWRHRALRGHPEHRRDAGSRE